MSNVPAELKYASTHEWVRAEGEGIYRVGISDHAQQSLGDMVFIELPAVDDDVEAGEACAVTESVKAAADIYAPISGKIVEVNTALSDAPEWVNSAPYAERWLFCIQASDESARAELAELLDAADYRATLGA